MGATTEISWADATFNPWVGCQHVSPACDHCYAESWAKRTGQAGLWGDGERRRTSAANWRQPLKWDRDAREAGIRRRVFCASLADVFDNAVPAAWRSDLFQLIEQTPHLDWMLLTKRIGNVRAMTRGVSSWPNVWLGSTVVNQEEADRDIPKLLATPAAVRFLSIEPMLGPINLQRFLEPCDAGSVLIDGGAGGGRTCPYCNGHTVRGSCHPLNWVIVGGESGGQARPMHAQWVRDIRDQCAVAGVAFHFKQWGEWHPTDQRGTQTVRAQAVHEWGDDAMSIRIGKQLAGHELDGREHKAFPESAA